MQDDVVLSLFVANQLRFQLENTPLDFGHFSVCVSQGCIPVMSNTRHMTMVKEQLGQKVRECQSKFITYHWSTNIGNASASGLLYCVVTKMSLCLRIPPERYIVGYTGYSYVKKVLFIGVNPTPPKLDRYTSVIYRPNIQGGQKNKGKRTKGRG